MTRKQALHEFHSARASYRASGSKMARRRLTRAFLRALQAGWVAAVTNAETKQAAREDAVIARAMNRGRKSA